MCIFKILQKLKRFVQRLKKNYEGREIGIFNDIGGDRGNGGNTYAPNN